MTHIENIHIGQFVTLVDVHGDYQIVNENGVTGEIAITHREAAVRGEVQRCAGLRGEVMKVEAISPPFVAVSVFPSGGGLQPTRTMLDVRIVDLKQLPDDYVAFFVQPALDYLQDMMENAGYIVKKKPRPKTKPQAGIKSLEELLNRTIGPNSETISMVIGPPGETGPRPIDIPGLEPDENEPDRDPED